MKRVGVLCPIFSLPSQYGVGDFGKCSYDFANFLAKRGLNIWEILPLNRTNNNSPYSSIATFSFDEMFVDLDDLIERGLLTKKECKILKKYSKNKKIDYKNVKKIKFQLFSLAFERADKNDISKAVTFAKLNGYLYRYAYFLALLEVFGTQNWREVDKKFWNISNDESQKFIKKYQKIIEKYAFFQYILSIQWEKLKKYANSKDIKIVGDLPIYCDKDSFEVFDKPEKFKLDKNFLPYVTGGSPPDDYFKFGQDWGLCIFNWTKLKKENYQYLIDRFKMCLKRYDILRIDHYVGLVEHYENAHDGRHKSKMVKEGGEELFAAAQKQINLQKFVLEDLYNMSAECVRVREKFGLRGMNIMQYAFDTDNKNPHLPQNVRPKNIYYLGNHDNNTFMGFLKSQSQKQIESIKAKLNSNAKSLKRLQKDAIKAAIASPCQTVIFQIQDLLFQDERYRTNNPGQPHGCWQYRVPRSYCLTKFNFKNF